MFAGEREPSSAVIERRSAPGCGRVAGFAVLREARVARILRGLVLRQVASGTRCPESRILSADVATGAGCRRMFARQRELGCAVIKRGSGPLRGGVTSLASLRESSSGVIRVCRGLELRQVARGTCSPQTSELSADVATRASGSRMFTCERELGCIVVEVGSAPGRRRVTGFASLRESCVTRVLRALVVRQVAGGACGTETCELSTHVTARAGR